MGDVFQSATRSQKVARTHGSRASAQMDRTLDRWTARNHALMLDVFHSFSARSWSVLLDSASERAGDKTPRSLGAASPLALRLFRCELGVLLGFFLLRGELLRWGLFLGGFVGHGFFYLRIRGLYGLARTVRQDALLGGSPSQCTRMGRRTSPFFVLDPRFEGARHCDSSAEVPQDGHGFLVR